MLDAAAAIGAVAAGVDGCAMVGLGGRQVVVRGGQQHKEVADDLREEGKAGKSSGGEWRRVVGTVAGRQGTSWSGAELAACQPAAAWCLTAHSRPAMVMLPRRGLPLPPGS